ncbi:MAG: hypothetical protein AAGA18_00215 [Verrucomicrobiota bacterium]
MKSNLFLVLVVFLTSHQIHYVYGQTANKEKKINEFIEKVQVQLVKALDRIEEIDKIVDPYLEKIVQQEFLLKASEYQMLKKQSENASIAKKFFEKANKQQDDTFSATVQYLDNAYEALKVGELWIGSEGSLVEKDAKLFKYVKSEAIKVAATMEGGAEILELINERDELISKFDRISPLFDYYLDRQEWWQYYQDYQDELKYNDRYAKLREQIKN